MSETELRRMIDAVSRFAETEFARTREIVPMFHAITATGQTVIEPWPVYLGKDAAAALMRQFFAAADVVRYVYVNEAWTLDIVGLPEAEQRRIIATGCADHPQRKEVVMISGEDRDCGQMLANRPIVRPSIGAPYLGPLTLDQFPQSEGRMVGMLPVRGTRQ